MERDFINYEENIKSALQGLKRRETDIFSVVEKSMQALTKRAIVSITNKAAVSDRSVWVDEERIYNALVNLETNAVEAMPDGGELAIGRKSGVIL